MTEDIVSYHADIENDGECSTFRIEITARGDTRRALFRGFVEDNILDRLTCDLNVNTRANGQQYKQR